ncbi:MAG: L-threonylcarbamoyladenylate synthase [Planctomycetota bacterium]
MLDTDDIKRLPDDGSVPAAAKELADALRSGGVVGIPTETVYGLAVRADDDGAMARLVELKGREATKATTWHVASASALEGFAGFGPRARRLAARYWPGPLTLVLPGVPAGLERAAKDGWIGVRCPAHSGARAVLAACDFPVVASSANRSGESPCVDAACVRAAFGSELAGLGDGGACRVAEASVVLAIGPGRFEVLREGLLSREQLVATSGRRIAFVCTGNTCRSPMAEALARRAVEERVGTRDLASVGFEVASFGVFAGPGAPASQHSVEAMARRGLDLSRHGASPAVPERLATFDSIYGLTRSHVEALVSILPPRLAGRVELLDPKGRDVPDPVGKDLAEYLRCADAIEAAIRERAPSWA